jgi:hypothetical protein
VRHLDQRKTADMANLLPGTGVREVSIGRSTSGLTDSKPFVHPDRIAALRAVRSEQFDLSRLIRLCEELNSSWKSGVATFGCDGDTCAR